jgi:hypothetical protein
MGSHGDLTVETDQGRIVDSLDIYIGDLMRIIDAFPADELRTSHCLQYIDAYGDTVFNMLQKERLVLELGKVSSRISDAGDRECLARVINFIEPYKDKVHLYIKFHGD